MALAFCSGRSKETCEGKARPGYAPIVSKIDALETQNARSEPRKDKSGRGRALSNGRPQRLSPQYEHTCAPVWAYSLALQVL
ncbi:hypothetical protein SNK03_13621 [Fusarium graminearum]|nr:hypothetical protein FG05_13078 [Fusarium graminearum]